MAPHAPGPGPGRARSRAESATARSYVGVHDGARRVPDHRPPPIFPSLGGYDRTLAARRPDRRAHGVGRARPRGAGLRLDRRRLAGRRPLRGPAGAGPLRRLRQLAPPRRRPDVGDRGAVGRGRRRPDHRWARRHPRVHRRAGARHRRHRPGRRPAAPRLPRQLHLRAGAQGLHHRPGPDDHHRPGPEAVRDREDRRQLLRAGVGRHPPPRRHPRPDARRRRRARWPSCSALRRWLPMVPGSLVAVIVGVVAVELFDLADKGVEIVGPIDSGLPSIGLPDGVGRRRLPARPPARPPAIMLVGLRRGPRRGQDVRRPGPLRDRRQPRADRPRRGQHRQPG